jgi:F-type H+-transporting ATPase subunit b
VLSAAWIVAASMAALILIAVALKVPAKMTKGLDNGIAEIRKQLRGQGAARRCRKLRADYAARIAGAAEEAKQLVAHAQAEAAAIIAKAEADTTDMIARREKIAGEKIEAAERAALAELRVKAAQAAAGAARNLIGAHYGAAADKAQVDAAIATL